MAMLIKTNRIFEFNTRALQAYKAMDEQCAREVGRVDGKELLNDTLTSFGSYWDDSPAELYRCYVQ
jgi:hypothetical protein